MASQELDEGATDTRRAADAAGKQDSIRTDTRLDEYEDILTDGVKQSGKDSRPVFAPVGKVGHIGLQDHRAATGKRSGIGHVSAEGACFADREGEAFNELAEEIACPLRTATILAKHRQPTLAQLQDGEAVVANVDDRRRCISEGVAVSAELCLFRWNLGEPELTRKAAGDTCTIAGGGPLVATSKYKASSSDGKDTDRMTWLPDN